jgi:DNA-binding CsgD family transcriptional regulator
VDLCRRGLAWALAAGGRFDDARLALANALDLSDELGQPAVSLLVCHDLLRMGDTSRVERIIALASASFGPYPAATSAHARGVRAGSGDLLAQASLGFEQCGALVQAAEVAAAAAEAYRRAGKPRQATAQSARAATLSKQLAGVHTIGLARPHEAAAALSARENEVAVLAAQRMAAADIAERLYLSRRTVENHLQRIYIKLGISSRAELELALGSAAPDRAD